MIHHNIQCVGLTVDLAVYCDRIGDMKYVIKLEKEEDGRWIAGIESLPGVLAYGKTEKEAISRAEALALRVVAERIENGELDLSFSLSFSTL